MMAGWGARTSGLALAIAPASATAQLRKAENVNIHAGSVNVDTE
jgi:hypothetical protein